MERFKCETAHAVNRILGRRQVTVWGEGYDSPVILTLDDLVEKLAYVYANPVRAHRTASIRTYQGVSSWEMFTSGNLSRQVKRIRRTFLGPVATGRVSAAVRQQEASLVDGLANEILAFTLSPDAWTVAFPNQASSAMLRERLLTRIEEIERAMADTRERERISLPSASQIASQPIDMRYAPKTFGRRMWCICRDIRLRNAFISFMKSLRVIARTVRLKWLGGDTREPFPTGLFPPSPPMLSSLLPAHFRRSIALM